MDNISASSNSVSNIPTSKKTQFKKHVILWLRDINNHESDWRLSKKNLEFIHKWKN